MYCESITAGYVASGLCTRALQKACRVVSTCSSKLRASVLFLQQCGQVVCDPCSTNRKYLESSRSGAPKRICDKCSSGTSGGAGAARDSDEDSDGGAAGKAGKLSLDGKDKEGKSGGETARRPAPGMPLIKIEDACKALKEHRFAGCWEAMLTFHVVELGRGGGGDELKPGSRLHILMDLETKGASYFKGTVSDFGELS